MMQRLQHLYGYDVLDCYTSDPANVQDGSGRADKREEILRDRLKAAAVKLNPRFQKPPSMMRWIKSATGQAMATMAANRELDGLIRDGARIELKETKKTQ